MLSAASMMVVKRQVCTSVGTTTGALDVAPRRAFCCHDLSHTCFTPELSMRHAYSPDKQGERAAA